MSYYGLLAEEVNDGGSLDYYDGKEDDCFYIQKKVHSKHTVRK